MKYVEDLLQYFGGGDYNFLTFGCINNNTYTIRLNVLIREFSFMIQLLAVFFILY